MDGNVAIDNYFNTNRNVSDDVPFGKERAANIAHALTRGMGWGSCEPPELPHEALAVKAGGTGETPIRDSSLAENFAHFKKV